MRNSRRAVDARRLEDVLRDPDEEVAQQEDRERQPERRCGTGSRPSDRVEQAERVVEREDRDQRHLQRHHEQRDHDDEQPVAAGELEPGERVARERRDDDRQDRAADRDLRPSSTARSVMSLLSSSVAVVRPGREARLREDLPPAARRDQSAGQQRGEEAARASARARAAPTTTSRRLQRRLAEHAQRSAPSDALARRPSGGLDGGVVRPRRPSDLPPEAADVEQQHRDHEQEQEHGDRRAEPEVVDAAERRAPHRERDHVRVVLRRAGRDRRARCRRP